MEATSSFDGIDTDLSNFNLNEDSSRTIIKILQMVMADFLFYQK